MKAKFLTALGLGIISTALLVNTASAASSSWSFPTDPYWRPYSGTLFAFKHSTYPQINANLSFYWNSTQVQKLQQSISRYPTFDIRDHSKDSFDGTYIYSTLPDPKYDYEDDDVDSRIDELEVVLRNHWAVTTKNYTVETVWAVKNTLNNPKLTSYACVSDQPIFPGRDYNTVFGTSEFLTELFWNAINGSAGFASTNHAFMQNTNSSTPSTDSLLEGDDSAKIDTEYESLRTTKDLQDYKMKTDHVLRNTNDDQSFNYIMTFKKPISNEKLQKIINHLEVKELYAHGKNETGEQVTIGTNKINFSVLNQLVMNPSYEFTGFTEIEGSATAKELKKYLNYEEVFSVEIATENLQPKGLGWKLANLK